MAFMAGNSFGELFRVTTAGVSHGPGYMVIIDGCPPGLPLSEEDLLPDLRRRRPGQSKIVTQRKEEDLPEIIEYYLRDHAEFDFDEIEIVNNRPMNIWLYAKCRKYVDPDNPKDAYDAEVEVKGEYDDNPTGR